MYIWKHTVDVVSTMPQSKPADSPIEIISSESASRLAEIFAALADPNRLRIISALSHHKLSVGRLAELVQMTESATSHQLRLLRAQRIVRTRKVGRQVFYFLDDQHIHDLLDRGLDHVGHS
jgi:DNA-binding transcriptional ArsR family regulator